MISKYRAKHLPPINSFNSLSYEEGMIFLHVVHLRKVGWGLSILSRITEVIRTWILNTVRSLQAAVNASELNYLLEWFDNFL